MSMKKGSGLILVFLALVLFSSMFVSASWVSDLLGQITGNAVATTTSNGHTQVVLPGNGVWGAGNSYYNYTLANPMNASSISLVVGTVNGQVCVINVNYTNSTGASLALLTNQRINAASKTIAYAFSARQIDSIIVYSTSCNIYNILNLYNLTVKGDYNLIPLTVQDLLSTSVVASNGQINLSLAREMEITKVLNLSFITISNPSCVVDIYTASDSKMTKVDSFNLASFAVSRVINRSVTIANPTRDSKIVISSAISGVGNNRAYCFNGKINLTNVSVGGKVLASCVSNWQNSSWSVCNSSNQRNRTAVDLNGCLGSIRYVDACTTETCFTKCALNGSGVNVPLISSYPASCNYRGACGRDLLVSKNGTAGESKYDFVWRYNYKNGDSEDFCACDGNTSLGGRVVQAVAVDGYSLPVVINDSNVKTIASVDVFVFGFKDGNRSNYTKVSISEISYGCTGSCFALNEKRAVEDSNPSNYVVCERNGTTTCFKNSSVQQCGSAMIFDAGLKECVFTNLADSCTDRNDKSYFCNFSSKSLTGSEVVSSRSCGVPGVACLKCGSGSQYDELQGFCVSNSCFNQPGGIKASNCSIAGGICNNSLQFTNAIKNSSLDCCNGDFSCFICDSDYHSVNGTVCVSNNCSDVNVPSGSGVNKGANNTNSSSANMNWNYVSGVPGACQWNCSAGYRKNNSNNMSCIEGLAPCSEFNGICSTIALVGSKPVSDANCSVGSCVVCDEQNGYIKNGSVCSRGCLDNKVWNGFSCVTQKPGCDGCVLDNKCVGNDTSKVVRVNVRVNGVINRAYCDTVSNPPQLKTLLADGQSCLYSAQCSSNLCAGNATSMTCLNIKNEVANASGWMKDIFCWIRNGFNRDSSGYIACVTPQSGA